MSISAAPDDVSSTFIATDDATGEAADTGTTGGSSTATGGTSAASKGVQKVCCDCMLLYPLLFVAKHIPYSYYQRVCTCNGTCVM